MSITAYYRLLLVLVTFVSCMGISFSVSFEKDLTLTRKQKIILDQFKALVRDRLPHEYMLEDIYLIRWLRARNFRIRDAEAMLMKNLAWREKNNMDNILNEDWSDFRESYRFWIDGEDKEGRPILFGDIGEWDIRKATLTGKGPKLIRYIDYIYEKVNVKLRELQRQGKNVTQYYFLLDMDGYTVTQQGCAACFPVTSRVVTTYENYYPGNNHKTVLVNTPVVFQSLLNLLKPLMSPPTRDALYIYGKQDNTKEILRRDIADDQLSVELGGSRIIPNYSIT